MPLATIQSSPARTAAAQLLEILGIDEPPLTVDLVVEGLGLSVHNLPRFDLDRLTPKQRLDFGSVRALLSPAEQRIYLNGDMAPCQKKFPVFHEAGHGFIQWHQQILYLDCDFTLSRKVRDLMEIEANEFAVYVQFLGDKFRWEARGLPFGLASALELKDRYATSIESTIRHYVETSDRDCICQVFRIEGEALRLQYFTRPLGMFNRFCTDCKVGQLLLQDHPLAQQLGEMPFSLGLVAEDDFQCLETLTIRRHCFCDGCRLFVLEFESPRE